MNHTQFRIMNAILAYKRENTCSPTLRELANAVGLSAKSWGVVSYHLRRLQATGHIANKNFGEARALRVLKMPYKEIWHTNSEGELVYVG